MDDRGAAPPVDELDALIRERLTEAQLDFERLGVARYVVVLRGEHKLETATAIAVREHSLTVEAFFMRCPESNLAETYRFLLQRNMRTYGVHFAVDANGDVFLTGRLPLHAVTADELDRLLGCVLTYSDETFNAALRLGFRESIRAEAEWRAKRGLPAENLRGLLPPAE
ncbi:MAG: YbjN domain-containing protein [Frankia sp.]|nr:YbjN domain-containing protein [Frankia sp.]